MKVLLKSKTHINSCEIVEFILPAKYSFVCLNHCILTKAMRKYHMDKNVKVKRISENIIQVIGTNFIEKWKLIDNEWVLDWIF